MLLVFILTLFADTSFLHAKSSVSCLEKGLKLKTVVSNTFYPEGPTNIPGEVIYVEYSTHNVMKLYPDAKRSTLFWSEAGCGPAGSILTRKSTLLISCYDSKQIVELSLQGNVLNRYTHPEMTGPNDFAQDRDGNIYLSDSGVFDPSRTPEGRIYFLPYPTFNPSVLLTNLHYPNGLYVDSKQLIVAEHFKQQLQSFKLDSPGHLKSISQKNLITLPLDNSSPYNGADGFKRQKNHFWIAHYGTGAIEHFTIKGKYLGTIHLNKIYKNVTNILVIGEKQNKLLITVSNEDEKNMYPGLVLELDLSHLPPGKFSCQF